jgi:hypothetical protein
LFDQIIRCLTLLELHFAPAAGTGRPHPRRAGTVPYAAAAGDATPGNLHSVRIELAALAPAVPAGYPPLGEAEPRSSEPPGAAGAELFVIIKN